MALLPLHHEFPCKGHVFQHGTSTRHSRGQVLFDTNGSRRFSSSARTFPYSLSSRGKLCLVRASSETKIIKERLKLLDSYFGKLQGGDEKKPSIATGDDEKAKLNVETELESLSVYLDKQQKGTRINNKIFLKYLFCSFILLIRTYFTASLTIRCGDKTRRRFSSKQTEKG